MAEPKLNEKTGKWEFVVDHYVNGKRKQVRRKGFSTKREANAAKTKLLKEIQDDQFVNLDKITVETFLRRWLETERKFEVDETTHYNNMLYFKNHIIPRIGHYKMQKLDAFICQEFINAMHRENYARNTIDRVTTILKKAFDRAIDYRIIKENVMRKTKLPKRVKLEQKYWTAAQATEFLSFTRQARYFIVYALALFTGMRQGEILGLRWQDIDFEKKTLQVNQTLTNYGKSLKFGAKTVSGVRTISLPDKLIEFLLEHRKFYEETINEIKNQLGKDFVDYDLVVFNYSTGGTVFPSNLTKTYIKDVKGSGLPHIPFHSLRHTHATMLIEQNVNVKLISERLGHSKIAVTLDVYSHVTPNMQHEVASQLDQIIAI
ncbi:site-specific integrase [Paenibacillus sp. MMO-58]|uniref:site-specific integrase n=1 Tax=Paenibacillus sp. MMO-58 TaxID=3081290 RepID=UPI0030185026